MFEGKYYDVLINNIHKPEAKMLTPHPGVADKHNLVVAIKMQIFNKFRFIARSNN